MAQATAIADIEKKTGISLLQYDRLALSFVEPWTPSRLFDFEVEGLAGKGLIKYVDADSFRGRLPTSGLFLFVPPRPKGLDESDFQELMSLVNLGGRAGVSHMEQRVETIIDVPEGASLLTDVRDGRDSPPHITPRARLANILCEKRHPYDLWRGIVHLMLFPEVLMRYELHFMGSRCLGPRSDLAPQAWINDSRPALIEGWVEYIDTHNCPVGHVVPSAGAVLV